MVIQNRHRSKVLVAIALTACAITTLPLTWSRAAHAQEFTDTDVANYARAAVEIEAARQATYEEASNILAAGGELDILETRLSCNATRMGDLPDLPRPDRVDLRTVLVTFCNEARDIAESHTLTPKRFNRITEAHRDDAALAERIQAEIASLEEG